MAMTPEEHIAQKAQGMPASFRATYLKAMRGNSKAAAIKAFCCECVGYEDAVEQIRHCTALTCPLFPYRPYRRPADRHQKPAERS